MSSTDLSSKVSRPTSERERSSKVKQNIRHFKYEYTIDLGLRMNEMVIRRHDILDEKEKNSLSVRFISFFFLGVN